MLLQGRFAEAEKLALEIEVVAEAQQIQAGNVLAALQIQFFGLRYLQGRVGEVVPVMRMLVANNPGFANTGGPWARDVDRGPRRPEEARAEIERSRGEAGGLSNLPATASGSSTLTSLSEACSCSRMPRHARELYVLLEPFAARNALCAAVLHGLGRALPG